MYQETNLTIANEIKNQLGNKCLFMLGAKNIAGGSNYLSFRIRGSKDVNHIRIELNSMDTYTVTFSKIHNLKVKIVSSHNNIYFDMLHDLIRSETGLNTNL